eukprot:s3268_g1.t1
MNGGIIIVYGSNQVGEHEQFFYSNAYNGVQVAVCFDSSFPHFRVNTMSAGYVKRRERMPELMANAFQKLGFERAMFLFRKYDHGRMSDYDELLDKTVPPWHIGHDTCGPPTAPPVPFAQVMVVILSSADQQGKIFRSVLRGSRGWMNRFLQLGGVGSLRWVFAVYPRSDESTLHVTLEEENDLHKDMLILPASDRIGKSSRTAGPTTDHLLQVFALLRDFQFRFLAICRQDVFVSFQHFMDTLQLLEPPAGKVLGEWQPTPTSWSNNENRADRDDMVAIGRFYVALLLLPAAAQPAWPDPFPIVRPERPRGNRESSKPRALPAPVGNNTAEHDERDGPLMDPVPSNEELPPREGVSLRGSETKSGSSGTAGADSEANGNLGAVAGRTSNLQRSLDVLLLHADARGGWGLRIQWWQWGALRNETEASAQRFNDFDTSAPMLSTWRTRGFSPDLMSSL